MNDLHSFCFMVHIMILWHFVNLIYSWMTALLSVMLGKVIELRLIMRLIQKTIIHYYILIASFMLHPVIVIVIMYCFVMFKWQSWVSIPCAVGQWWSLSAGCCSVCWWFPSDRPKSRWCSWWCIWQGTFDHILIT